MNLYEILQLNNNASEIEIKKAYHKLALLYHPDKNKNPKANEKFQNIQTAYQILSNQKSRIDYSKLNQVEQHNFVDLLQKIFRDNIMLEEIKHFGINFDKNDWKYLENNFKDLFAALNLKELLVLFKQGKFPKKKIDTNFTISETDNDEFNDEDSESFFNLPIYYQKNNNLDIFLNLNINLNDIAENRKKKIKIKRTVNNEEIYNTFIFNLDKPYIVFPNCGDILDLNYGNLIIKLNLPNNFYWDDNMIIIEQQISLYEMIYGLDINLNICDTEESTKQNGTQNNNITIHNWIPSRDGFFIEINQIKIKLYTLNIKLVLNYEHTNDKKNILYKYFSK